jgi:hypothetical protein
VRMTKQSFGCSQAYASQDTRIRIHLRYGQDKRELPFGANFNSARHGSTALCKIEHLNR